MDQPAPSTVKRSALYGLLLLAGVAAIVLVLRDPSEKSDSASRGDPVVPDLGSQGRDLTGPPQPEPEPTQHPGAQETLPESAVPGETDESAVVHHSAIEMDIVIGRLIHAARVGDARGLAAARQEVRTLRPSDEADRRLADALAAESEPRVRMELFQNLHADDSRLAWVRRVYETRGALWMGTAEPTQAWEVNELALYAGFLLPARWRDEPGPALLRNALQRQRPQWLIELLLSAFVLGPEQRDAFETLWPEVSEFLRGFSGEVKPGGLLLTWLHCRPEGVTAASLLRDPELSRHFGVVLASGWAGAAAEQERALLMELAAEQLAAEREPARRARLLDGLLADPRLRAEARRLVEDGLARRDAGLADFLAALGSLSDGAADLERLRLAADGPDADASRGAIEGLRRSPLGDADVELRGVLDAHADQRARSQALAALLDRAPDKGALLDEFLQPERDARLRAVTVAHVPAADLERLKRTAEQDASPSVRQAAVTRLGDLKDPALRNFFLRIRERDASPVIRQLASRYAEELRER
jgi:hypothetical protein